MSLFIVTRENHDQMMASIRRLAWNSLCAKYAKNPKIQMPDEMYPLSVSFAEKDLVIYLSTYWNLWTERDGTVVPKFGTAVLDRSTAKVLVYHKFYKRQDRVQRGRNGWMISTDLESFEHGCKFPDRYTVEFNSAAYEKAVGALKRGEPVLHAFFIVEDSVVVETCTLSEAIALVYYQKNRKRDMEMFGGQRYE